jgi:hypothetical protein
MSARDGPMTEPVSMLIGDINDASWRTQSLVSSQSIASPDGKAVQAKE